MNHISIPFQIANPSLWYPNGYGPQTLYKFFATLSTVKGKKATAEDRAELRTGLRSIELQRTPDQWGKSFTFVVNGIPIFAKGADVIPFDSFATRVTPAQHRQILEAARDAHMNMIRHWGGGYYETNDFYDICDELGIMVWQDFMFGGQDLDIISPIMQAHQKNVGGNERIRTYMLREFQEPKPVISSCRREHSRPASAAGRPWCRRDCRANLLRRQCSQLRRTRDRKPTLFPSGDRPGGRLMEVAVYVEKNESCPCEKPVGNGIRHRLRSFASPGNLKTQGRRHPCCDAPPSFVPPGQREVGRHFFRNPPVSEIRFGARIGNCSP